MAESDFRDDWNSASPASAGFDEQTLADIEAAHSRGELPNLHGLVVARNGSIVFERYFAGTDEVLGRAQGEVRFDATTLHDMRSVSKSIVSVLYGIALEEGIVPPPTASLLDQFPAYADLAPEPARRKWTIEDVLTMRMGIEWDETLPYTDPRNGEIAMENAPDRFRYILERPLAEEPGTSWNYCGGTTAILANLVALGSGTNILEYARSRLFEPLSIQNAEWTAGSDGEPAAAAGLRLRPRDLAKVGQLLLNDGLWHGVAVVPRAWLKECFVPRTQTRWRMLYGYQWYLDSEDGVSWIAASGNGGQYLFIAPSLNLTFACTAGNYNQWVGPPLPLKIARRILAAVNGSR